MFWADQISENLADEIIHDSKTPSGPVHVGALRGVILHDTVFKILTLQKKNLKTKMLYGCDDFDPMDELPDVLPPDFQDFMGQPLYTVPPPPNSDAQNLSDHYMNQFVQVYQNLGAKPIFYKMSHLYQQGKLNPIIQQILEQKNLIREIYFKVSGSKKNSDWYPFQVICQKCQKIGTTLVHHFDGKNVEYTCQTHLVKWASGCGYHGQVSPFDGNGKLPWKLEWIAKWKYFDVSFEGSGKDHSSRGGSRDVSNSIFSQIFQKTPPKDMPYEFFLVNKKKMSSSKNIGFSAKDIVQFLPPEILRFLMVRYPPHATIDFDPSIENTIPSLFDEYDRCAQLFFSQDFQNPLARAFELSNPTSSPQYFQPRFFPRFSTIATLVQIPHVNIQHKVQLLKQNPLQPQDIQELKKRNHYAHLWLQNYAPTSFKFHLLTQFPESIRPKITPQLQLFIQTILPIFQNQILHSPLTGEFIHQQIYSNAKKLSIKPSKAFQFLYQIFIGQKYGPRLGTFLAALDQQFLVQRLTLALPKKIS